MGTFAVLGCRLDRPSQNEKVLRGFRAMCRDCACGLLGSEASAPQPPGSARPAAATVATSGVAAEREVSEGSGLKRSISPGSAVAATLPVSPALAAPAVAGAMLASPALSSVEVEIGRAHV